jgi:histidinol-phosphate aminotransferase
MERIKKLIRKNIIALKPYSSARDEFSGDDSIFLDANENPFGKLNRYPDPYQNELKEKLSQVKGIDKANLFISNGSDEAIDLIFRTFCQPGKDKAIAFNPSYGMYKVSAQINDVELIELDLDEEFQIKTDELSQYYQNKEVKLMFICSPNNPSGNITERRAIEEILNNFNGIVVLDEAYIEFSGEQSASSMLNKYDNLIVTQTMSKAWGLAAARIGITISNPYIVGILNKVKPPYNVGGPNQMEAIKALDNEDYYKSNLMLIEDQKKRLESFLKQVPFVAKIYKSQANFVLIKVDDADRRYNQLKECGIITRNRTNQIKNTLRISIGNLQEMKYLFDKLINLER